MNPWAWIIPLAIALAIAGVAAWIGARAINKIIDLVSKPKRTVRKTRTQSKPKPKIKKVE